MTDLKLTDDARAEILMEILEPCLKKSKNPDWSTYRYYTSWGSKSPEGLKNVILRVMCDSDFKG